MDKHVEVEKYDESKHKEKFVPYVEKVKEVWYKRERWEMSEEEESWIYEKLFNICQKMKQEGVEEKINLPLTIAAIVSGMYWQRTNTVVQCAACAGRGFILKK